MGAQHRKLQRLAAFGGQVPAGQPQRMPPARPPVGAVLQGGLGDVFAAQKIRHRPLGGLQHGQQDVAGVGQGTPLLAGQGQRPAYGMGCLPGQTLLKIQHTFSLFALMNQAGFCAQNQYRRPGGK